MTDQPTMTDLDRAIKAGCEAHECVYPTCIASDGTLCRQHQRYLLAAFAALDPPSEAVVEAVRHQVMGNPGHALVRNIIRAYLAAIMGEK